MIDFVFYEIFLTRRANRGYIAIIAPVHESGWMALAQRHEQGVTIQVYRPGQLPTTEPRVSHNVYLPAGAVIHTVKYGEDASRSDWHADAELDRLTKPMTEDQIMRLAGKTSHLGPADHMPSSRQMGQ